MVTTKTRKKTGVTTAEKTLKSPKSTKDTEEANEKYEEIKKGDMHITALQKMTIKVLQDTARKEGIKECSGLKKQELIFKILKERVNQNAYKY